MIPQDFCFSCIKYRDWSKYYPRSFLIRHISKIISGKIALTEERKGSVNKAGQERSHFSITMALVRRFFLVVNIYQNRR